MIKILIVDDEKIIRKGLVKIVNSLQGDFQIVGEAANGIEALSIMENELPDAVITDIKMPKMGGIELIQRIEKQYPQVKRVVLSGFDEFSYVRETMKMGAIDYLLKPVDLDQLKELLKRIQNELLEETERRMNAVDMKIKLNESLPLLKEQFIHELICEGKNNSHESIEEKLKYYDIEISSGKYYVVTVSIDNARSISFEYE